MPIRRACSRAGCPAISPTPFTPPAKTVLPITDHPLRYRFVLTRMKVIPKPDFRSRNEFEIYSEGHVHNRTGGGNVRLARLNAAVLRQAGIVPGIGTDVRHSPIRRYGTRGASGHRMPEEGGNGDQGHPSVHEMVCRGSINIPPAQGHVRGAEGPHGVGDREDVPCPGHVEVQMLVLRASDSRWQRG